MYHGCSSGMPMAVLVPPFPICGRARKSLRLSLVQVFYVLVPGTLLPSTLIAFGIPFSHWQTPLGSCLLYFCLIPGDIAVAETVFLLIGRVSGVLRKPASAAR